MDKKKFELLVKFFFVVYSTLFVFSKWPLQMENKNNTALSSSATNTTVLVWETGFYDAWLQNLSSPPSLLQKLEKCAQLKKGTTTTKKIQKNVSQHSLQLGIPNEMSLESVGWGFWENHSALFFLLFCLKPSPDTWHCNTPAGLLRRSWEQKSPTKMTRQEKEMSPSL